MNRIKNLDPYICSTGTTLGSALRKINLNESRIIFIINDTNQLVGCMSDGDLRRAFDDQTQINTMSPIENFMHKNFKAVFHADVDRVTNDIFRNGIEIVPVLDTTGRLLSFLKKGEQSLHIGSYCIKKENHAFIIAEIGNNHQGNLETAKELVDAAVKAEVNCVKFQMRNNKALYGQERLKNNSADLGPQYVMDLLTKFQLSDDELFEIFDYCKAKDVIPLCTPWDNESLRALEDYGMEAYKVASADFTNFELLSAIARTNKPMLCSTGMSTEFEIKKTIDLLENIGANYALLHCNSTYPTPYRDVNLLYLNRLSKLTKSFIGYSGHERGYIVPVAAITLGAKIIEKHITLDKEQEGTDHKVSLLPDEFANMVRDIRIIEEALGDSETERAITQGELINRENLAKSIVAANDINKGEIIERKDLVIRSPGQGMQPYRISELIGRVANRNIAKDSCLYETDIMGQIEKKQEYKFSLPTGVPVRYHDYTKIMQNTKLDFVEFHLSYQDLGLRIEDFIQVKQDIGFAVHCPELFTNDHILDLASDNPEYRSQSIIELKNVINVTQEIGKIFPKSEKPILVINVGGWNRECFISEEDKRIKYKLVADALSSIGQTNVTFSVQTMPPFPWHFGGQSHHNLFINPREIQEFCQSNPEIKICLDTSHLMMACNYFGWDFYDSVELLLPYTNHMHIVDATGIDGEGVQIGKGDINFKKLSQKIKSAKSNAQFIPEIWQGHKNSGEGFWQAFDYLKNIDFCGEE